MHDVTGRIMIVTNYIREKQRPSTNADRRKGSSHCRRLPAKGRGFWRDAWCHRRARLQAFLFLTVSIVSAFCASDHVDISFFSKAYLGNRVSDYQYVVSL
ncbi:hypothetical protein GCM10022290_37430 [Sagittula marina]